MFSAISPLPIYISAIIIGFSRAPGSAFVFNGCTCIVMHLFIYEREYAVLVFLRSTYCFTTWKRSVKSLCNMKTSCSKCYNFKHSKNKQVCGAYFLWDRNSNHQSRPTPCRSMLVDNYRIHTSNHLSNLNRYHSLLLLLHTYCHLYNMNPLQCNQLWHLNIFD